MGPGNRVSMTPPPLGHPDYKYWRHDVAYGAIGPKAYVTFNKADQELLRAPTHGWPDVLSKAIFYAKGALLGGPLRGFQFFDGGGGDVFADDGDALGPPVARHRGQDDGSSGVVSETVGKGSRAHMNTRTRIVRY